VAPKGKAPTWNQFGNGIWATDPGYAAKILNLYSDMLASAGLTLA
jgi:flagellum-specific peptidoglycan hydrolase FlgJ